MDDQGLGTNFDAPDACQVGTGGAYACSSLSPWAVDSSLSYGFVATSDAACGQCYRLDFTGGSNSSAPDAGSSELAGRSMVVRTVSFGGGASGHFDILVPGGGVGAFNGCSAQWGISENELGPNFGGLLTQCKQQLGPGRPQQEYVNCLLNRCNDTFQNRGLPEYVEGCRWYAEWFRAAEQPRIDYTEVDCPSELSERALP